MNVSRRLGKTVGLLVLILGLILMFKVGLLEPSKIFPAFSRLLDFTSELIPPRVDVIPVLAWAMLETIEIAFLGTLLGFLMSIPLAFFGNRVLFGRGVTSIARLIIGAIRSIPSILYGVIFVVGFGLGPAAGTLGVAFYTVGYLGKFYYEAFEAVDVEVLEAVRSTGSSRLQLMRYAILPESTNTVISQLLFMFEYNIRASTIMGFVGAGGIGYYMLGYTQMLQYQHLFTALLMTFGVIMIIDFLSLKIRSTVLITGIKK